MKLLFDSDTRIEDSPFNGHTKTALKNAGFEKIKDLNKFNYRELIKFRNIGKKTIREIQYIISFLGLSLDVDECFPFPLNWAVRRAEEYFAGTFLTEDDFNKIVNFLRDRTFFKLDSPTPQQ
jgi:Bacterial RNA polymerase, alpha chain C terminal domain